MINQFSILYGSTTRIVRPKDERKFRATEQPEGENIFFRKKLGSTVVLTGDDYHFLYDIENSAQRCDEVFFLWERKCKEADPWTLFFGGVFGAGDAKWDRKKCEVQFAPKTNDGYRVLLENYTREINVLNVTNTVTTSGRLETTDTFQWKEINIGEIGNQVDSDTWATFMTITTWVSGSVGNGVRNKIEYIFRTRTTRALINGQPVDLSDRGWILLSTDATTAYYAKPPEIFGFKPYVIGSNDDFAKFPDIIKLIAPATFDRNKFISLNENGANSGACGTGLRIRTYIGDNRCWDIVWEFGLFQFTRNRRLLEVIRYLLRQAAPNLEPTTDAELSGFFTAVINPVTGLANQVRDPLLAQLSDVKRYRSSEAATKGMLSLRDLLNDLRAALNVFGFINNRGKFQLEHLSYFGTSATFDLTIPKWAKQTSGSEAYEYLKAKMPRFEKLNFGVAQNDEFLEAVIEYSGACIVKDEGEDTATISVSKLTTDIEGVMLAGQSFPDAGFVLICQDGTPNIPKSLGGLRTRQYLNGHLSATNAFETYHKHGRVMPSGLLNGRTVNFLSVVRTKKQVDITVPVCCQAVDPTGKFITSESNDGRVVQMTYGFDGSVTFATVHDSFTATRNNTASDSQFDESFDLSFKS